MSAKSLLGKRLTWTAPPSGFGILPSPSRMQSSSASAARGNAGVARKVDGAGPRIVKHPGGRPACMANPSTPRCISSLGKWALATARSTVRGEWVRQCIGGAKTLSAGVLGPDGVLCDDGVRRSRSSRSAREPISDIASACAVGGDAAARSSRRASMASRRSRWEDQLARRSASDSSKANSVRWRAATAPTTYWRAAPRSIRQRSTPSNL